MQELEAAAIFNRIGIREIMLFDRIHVHSLDINIDGLWGTSPWYAATFEYLRQNDVLRELRNEDEDDDPWNRSGILYGPASANSPKRPPKPALQTQKDLTQSLDALLNKVFEDSVRTYAINLQRRNPTTTCVAIVGQDELRDGSPSRKKRPQVATVAEVIIRSLPVPTDDNPIERLLDFRNDPDTQAKLRALRDWMRKVAVTSRSATDIEDELKYGLQRYQEHMRIKRLKYRSGMLRTVIGTTLEILENLAHVKPKAAFDALFTVRDQQIALMEAEEAAPGREFAFIAKARQFRK